MKHLVLLRHAKSAWDDPELADHDRPLAPRGEAAAPLIGGYLAARGWVPDQALVSTALRARQTWDLVAAELPGEVPVVTTPLLYDADPEGVIRLARDCDDSVGCLILVGHNPTFEAAAQHLAGDRGDAEALARMQGKFPTAAAAMLTCDMTHWRQLAPDCCALADFVVPKMLA